MNRDLNTANKLLHLAPSMQKKMEKSVVTDLKESPDVIILEDHN